MRRRHPCDSRDRQGSSGDPFTQERSGGEVRLFGRRAHQRGSDPGLHRRGRRHRRQRRQRFRRGGRPPRRGDPRRRTAAVPATSIRRWSGLSMPHPASCRRATRPTPPILHWRRCRQLTLAPAADGARAGADPGAAEPEPAAEAPSRRSAGHAGRAPPGTRPEPRPAAGAAEPGGGPHPAPRRGPRRRTTVRWLHSPGPAPCRRRSRRPAPTSPSP